MAALRNLAVNTRANHGHCSIAAGLRRVSYKPFTCPWTSRRSPDQQHSTITRTLHQP